MAIAIFRFLGSALLSGFVALVVGGISPVQAKVTGISISPPFQEMTVDATAGNSSIPLSLTNTTSAEMSVTLSTINFGSLDQTGGVLLQGQNITSLQEKYGLAPWLILGQHTLVLAPHTTLPVQLSLRNDTSLAPGGHYGAVLASVSASSFGSRVGVNERLLSLLFIKKTGGEVYAMTLKTLQTRYSWWGDATQTSLTFHNDGNVHVIPRGTISVYDSLGRLAKRGIINDESGIILPASERLLHISLATLGVPLWPGYYRLVAAYRYDGSDQAHTMEESHFVLGLFTPILLLSLSLLSAWMIRLKRHYHKA